MRKRKSTREEMSWKAANVAKEIITVFYAMSVRRRSEKSTCIKPIHPFT
jgi:hypothetical protein